MEVCQVCEIGHVSQTFQGTYWIRLVIKSLLMLSLQSEISGKTQFME